MRKILPVLFLAAVFPALSPAQEVAAEAPGAAQDPPARVARLSYLRGDVSFEAAGSGGREDAEINRPITGSDRLVTGRDSRAELTFGIAAVRLDEDTELQVSNLDEDLAQFDLDSGTLGIHVRELERDQTLEVDTPNATVRLREPGDYRVEVARNGSTFVAVRGGGAQIDSGNANFEVREGEQVSVDGDQLAKIERIGPEDEFDRWSRERERQLNGSESARYVSRDVVGYEDLDEYGTWRWEPDYGHVWIPTRVAAGWAPYRFGRWTWISPWGWTWLDDSPWGFAPFHYGRWAHVQSRWCWVPGPRHSRAVYAPALVGWVGGPQVGVSISYSSRPSGWFPLGPREVYVPRYRVTPRYLRNINVSNTTIVNNTYITRAYRDREREARYFNRRIPGAVTSADSVRWQDRSRWQTADRARLLAERRASADADRSRRLQQWRERRNADDFRRDPAERPRLGANHVEMGRIARSEELRDRMIRQQNDRRQIEQRRDRDRRDMDRRMERREADRRASPRTAERLERGGPRAPGRYER